VGAQQVGEVVAQRRFPVTVALDHTQVESSGRELDRALRVA